eukprot:3629147-Rhodomonas_salina.7
MQPAAAAIISSNASIGATWYHSTPHTPSLALAHSHPPGTTTLKHQYPGCYGTTPIISTRQLRSSAVQARLWYYACRQHQGGYAATDRGGMLLPAPWPPVQHAPSTPPPPPPPRRPSYTPHMPAARTHTPGTPPLPPQYTYRYLHR